MHHIISKTLLLLTLALAITAMATPDWATNGVSASAGSAVVTAKGTYGLFKSCVSSDVSAAGVKGDAHACGSVADGSEQGKTLKTCQGLSVAAVVFLTLAMACEFVPLNEFKQCKMVGAVSYLIGMVLFLACVILFATKGKGGNSKFGYSYYLAVGALLTGVGAGVAGAMDHTKGPYGHLRPGLRPPQLVRQTATG